MKVTKPGVYSMDEQTYLADPVEGGSLSSTEIRRLLPPSCPAVFHYMREHPEPPSRTFDVGSAAHRLVLGDGPELVRIEAAEWRSKAVKAEVEAVRNSCGIPLKPADWDKVHEMADALRSHRMANLLFHPDSGEPEKVLVWDGPGGVRCRARLDWLRTPVRGERMIVPDYKTCISANPDHMGRAMADYGYHIQLAWYLSGVRALGLGDASAVGLLVRQEKTRPYLVAVTQPDHDAMKLADAKIREALRIYHECSTSGVWPGYGDGVTVVSLPPWELKDVEGMM